MKRILHVAWLWFLCSEVGLSRAFAQRIEVDFRRDVQPILAEHCFHCHGADPKTREGGLRLDLRDAALKGGESSGPAIVPGQAKRSAVIARITSTDAEQVMPPPNAKKPLTAAQIAIFKAWIEQGAAYEQHWSFVGPRKVATPAGEHPIDAIVRRKLAAAGLSMSPPAEPWVLERRLALDLIGLPSPAGSGEPSKTQHNTPVPPGEQLTALVQTLLDSPRYGERWARVWLDVARYADSNGYEKDLPREQWSYRDWVIEALNRDLPYDQFLIEQIAGDLLPNATQSQRIATGFLRNGLVNEEGAIVPEQFRIDSMFDRMDCLGKAVLGLSLQCAQCHTHKFDPIEQDEYYGMFAFLNNTFEAQSWVYTTEQQQEIEAVNQGLAAVEQRLKQSRPEWSTELARWEADVLRQHGVWTPLVPTELLSKSGLNHPTALADHSILTLGHPSTRSDIYIIGEPSLTGVTGLRFEALLHGDLPFNGPGFSKLGTWAITEFEVHTRSHGDKDWVKQTLKNASTDFAEPDHRIEEIWHSNSTDKERNRSVGPVHYMIDGSELTGYRADRGPGRRNSESVAVVQFDKPLTLPEGTRLRITLRTNHGGDDNGRSNVLVGRCRFALGTQPDPRVPTVDYAAVLAMQTPVAERTPAQLATVLAAWRANEPRFKALHDEAEKLWKRFPEAKTSVLHLAQRRGMLTRPTRVFDRGVWDRPRHTVQPGVPAALHALARPAANHEPDRLDFARWLADKNSPLTARVQVNRVWQSLFGVGLVETAEDFGTRTPEPVYRELLDWLAVDFMEHGWSQKHLLKTIVSSATYQQSSRVSAELARRDPGNRLLARGARFRADAEVIRDVVLSISGLLHHQHGGPSVFPPVPESVLEYNYFKPTYWKPPTDEQRYRRGIYLFRKRSMPDPVMSAFDAPNGDFACARRPRSNTPLAALTSLNEPMFVEAAQALAIRLLNTPAASDAERIDEAFRLCTGRPTTSTERDAIAVELSSLRARLKQGELKANEIAFSAFTKPQQLPVDATPNDIAAWTLVARVLLNLDETLTRH